MSRPPRPVRALKKPKSVTVPVVQTAPVAAHSDRPADYRGPHQAPHVSRVDALPASASEAVAAANGTGRITGGAGVARQLSAWEEEKLRREVEQERDGQADDIPV